MNRRQMKQAITRILDECKLQPHQRDNQVIAEQILNKVFTTATPLSASGSEYPPSISDVMEKYQHVQKIHAEVFTTLKSATPHVSNGTICNEDLVDLAFTCREMSKLGDDIRKESEQLQQSAEMAACLSHTTKMIADPTLAEGLKGKMASATPDVGTSPDLPKKDSPYYGPFMDWVMRKMGYGNIVGSNTNHELIRIHWPTISKRVTEAVAAGEQLPPGVRAERSVYRLNLRKR